MIVAHGLDARQSDQHQLTPIADAVEANLCRNPTQLSPDAGYCSDAMLAALEERGVDAYIAPGRAEHASAREDGGARIAPCATRSRPAATPASRLLTGRLAVADAAVWPAIPPRNLPPLLSPVSVVVL